MGQTIEDKRTPEQDADLAAIEDKLTTTKVTWRENKETTPRENVGVARQMAYSISTVLTQLQLSSRNRDTPGCPTPG